ncbi:MAG: hypothetical protein J6X88_00300 [Bacteroidales bacterium]|nr:hypothetical protein [Bacteroidales bacterium]
MMRIDDGLDSALAGDSLGTGVACRRGLKRIRKGFGKVCKRLKNRFYKDFLRYFPAVFRSESEAERRKSG